MVFPLQGAAECPSLMRSSQLFAKQSGRRWRSPEPGSPPVSLNAGVCVGEGGAGSGVREIPGLLRLRFCNPDVTGAYSWWSYRFNARKNNAGWRIDYFLVSDRIKEQITGTPIHNQVFGSDHCPVELTIEV